MIAVLCSLTSRVFGAPIETAMSTAHVDPVSTASAGEVRSVTPDGCRLYYCI
ncbi:unnamed protein product [Mycena citricolor]|uniref:Uncharacterized protein n=1 Tax=Mycena citricolor TaxID=2018698 RepID=A0AAD2Q411_9AGAR|nr:unnamed protein product [Mycena citricolor]CAK5273403.1 unnamed protein product [Mycena citricolor]